MKLGAVFSRACEFIFVLINKFCNLREYFLFCAFYRKVATVGQEQEGNFYTPLLVVLVHYYVLAHSPSGKV